MTDKKQQETDIEKREEERSNIPDNNAQEPGPLKKNPNPRANGNIPEEEGAPRPAGESTSGVGSEITDGEGG